MKSVLSKDVRIDWPAWGYLKSFLQANKLTLLGLVLFSAALSLANLPMLYAVRHIFRTVIPDHDFQHLALIGVALAAIRILASLLALLNRMVTLKITKGTVSRMRSDILKSLFEAPRDYFSGKEIAQLQVQIVQETERVDNLISAHIPSVLPATLTTIALSCVLFDLNWQLTLLMMIVAPLVWAGTVWTRRLIQTEVRDFQHGFEVFSRGVHFALHHMDLTRSRGYENEELKRQSSSVENLRDSGVRMAMSFAVNAQFHTTLTTLTGIAFLIGGGAAVMYGRMEMGALLAFYLAAGMINQAIGQITSVIPDLIVGNESLRKIHKIKSELPPPLYQGTQSVDFDQELRLIDVQFGYDDNIFLKDLNLSLRAGETLSIVGPNGSGKSTIVHLILGNYKPQSGSLSIDGVPYEKIDVSRLRRKIGIVLQKPSFFRGTIAENIAYGCLDASREAVVQAAHIACADRFIEALPDGYDTILGDGGITISGGEAQRLAIARALVLRPSLLILDEPTNHLDQSSVREIMSRLTSLRPCPAILIISHDPNVIQFTGKVLTVSDGSLTSISNATCDDLKIMGDAS